MTVTAVGGQHAVIHRDIPRIGNVGFLLRSEGQPTLFHPGDSYETAPAGVDILAVPAYGPWGAMKETVDFVRAVGALEGFPIHDELLSDRGRALILGRLSDLTEHPDRRSARRRHARVLTPPSRRDSWPAASATARTRARSAAAAHLARQVGHRDGGYRVAGVVGDGLRHRREPGGDRADLRRVAAGADVGQQHAERGRGRWAAAGSATNAAASGKSARTWTAGRAASMARPLAVCGAGSRTPTSVTRTGRRGARSSIR